MFVLHTQSDHSVGANENSSEHWGAGEGMLAWSHLLIFREFWQHLEKNRKDNRKFYTRDGREAVSSFRSFLVYCIKTQLCFTLYTLSVDNPIKLNWINIYLGFFNIHASVWCVPCGLSVTSLPSTATSHIEISFALWNHNQVMLGYWWWVRLSTYLWESKCVLCMADLRTSASGRMAFCGDVLGLASESPLSSSTSPIALT